LLLAGLRLAAALLLALLTWALTRILILLARVLVLLAHSGSPLLQSVEGNAISSEWLRKEIKFRRDYGIVSPIALAPRHRNRKCAAKTVRCTPFWRR
jgi:hypothetical protein